MVVSFLDERKVSVGLAVSSIVLGIIAIVSWIAGVGYIVSTIMEGGIEDYESYIGAMAFAAIFGIIAGIFQFIVMNQWASALKVNKDNTKIVLDYLNIKSQDMEEKFDISLIRNRIESVDIKTWAFWLYLTFYILNFLLPVYGILGILGFIFFAIYLQSIFSASNQLQDVKTKMYNALSKGEMLVNLNLIKRRNVGLVILLSIITLGIYIYYLLIALSKEINSFVDRDKELRDRLIIQTAKTS